MVIPFLSLYLVNSKGFTLPQVGWVMTSFGIGSLAGTWLGGKLTDSIGFYKVILFSLLIGGLGFIFLQYINTFYWFCFGIFSITFVSDSYRPAVFVAADNYSTPENVTRSVTLIRLAINLGFSIGPLLGGIIIATISYNSLFWIDGTTCIVAAIGLFFWLKPQNVKSDSSKESVVKEGISPYLNGAFILFFVIMVVNGVTFVQYFSLMPLYYEQAHFLSEDLIGWLFFINGSLIVIFEMPLIGWLERKNISKPIAIFCGVILLAFSFIVLNLTSWSGILVVGMILMTLGEMIGSPFANSMALEMAPKGRKGSYMGLYSMSYSFAHILGHNGGMNLVDHFGFNNTWNYFFLLLMFVSILTLWLYYLHKKKAL
jgi:predicted MFS family arabinose efflux permease